MEKTKGENREQAFESLKTSATLVPFSTCAQCLAKKTLAVLLTTGRSFHKAHTIRTVLPFWSCQVAKMYYGQMGAEGNMQRFVDALQGEKMLPEYESLRRIASIPNFLRPLLAWALRVVVGDHRKASILG